MAESLIIVVPSPTFWKENEDLLIVHYFLDYISIVDKTFANMSSQIDAIMSEMEHKYTFHQQVNDIYIYMCV